MLEIGTTRATVEQVEIDHILAFSMTLIAVGTLNTVH